MKYDKLVRDRIIEVIAERGLESEHEISSKEDYKGYLIRKLNEEVREFNEDPISEEIADILEVIDALKKLPEYSDVDDVQKEKRKDRGAFEKRIILKEVRNPDE